MTHTLNQQVVKNLFELPEVKELSKDCTQITIGDLHANMVLFLYFLVKNGIVEISAKNYNELVEIYKKGDNLTKENFEQFNTIIDSLVIKNKQILIRLIGDEVSDRGQNDYFIFKLLAKLQQEDINMEILVSNHGAEFLMRYEGKNFSKCFAIIPLQSKSSDHLQKLLDNQIIQYEELDKMIKTAYLPNLKLISYSIDNEKAISIYTHAPANLNDLKNRSYWGDNSIYHLAVFFNVEYDISSIPALIKTIDSINEHFRLCLQNQTATELFQEEQPLEQFTWSRRHVKQQDTLQNGYTTSFIHGHTQTKNDPSNVYNLDGSLGKELHLTSGPLKTLISSGSPAKDLIQKSEENSSNTNILARNASALVKENIQVLSKPFGSLKTPEKDKIIEKKEQEFGLNSKSTESSKASIPSADTSNPFMLDHELETQLRNGFEDKAFLFKNTNNSCAYQSQFIKKVQEKLGDSVTDESLNHIGPNVFLKDNEGFSMSHRSNNKANYISVNLKILSDKKNPGKIELGFIFGPWFISFKASGLVSCKEIDRDNTLIIHTMPLVTLRDSNRIFEFMKNLTKYITACNGSMDYDEKKFNEAHFIKYWLEYYGIWNNLSALNKKYLNEYSEKQIFPNIISLEWIGPNWDATLNLDDLCKKHGVEKEQLSKISPVILKSNDIRKLDNLFCEIIQIHPMVTSVFPSIRQSAELVRCMTIKQHGYSGLTSTNDDDSDRPEQYNWNGYEAGLEALAKLYGSVKTPVKVAETGNEQFSIHHNVNNKQKGLITFFASNNKKEPSHKFEAHIQKLQEELAEMILSLQLAATQALRAKKILAGLVEPLTFETQQLIQEKIDKLGETKPIVNAAITLNKLIQTLKEMSKGNTITQTQHQQLMAMNVFQQDENIANYNHVFASSGYSK